MTHVNLVTSSGIGSVLSGTTLGSLFQIQRIKNKAVLEKDKGDFQVYSSGEDLTYLVMNNYIQDRLPSAKITRSHH